MKGRWALVLHAALVVVGLSAIAVGFFVIGRGPVTCRGLEMHPGDTCMKSTYTSTSSDQVQSYEQRQAAAKASRPSVIGTGAAITAFGGMLWAAEIRKRRRSGQSDPR
ncbi:hypothetical protein [Aestuariimicrobium sp. T2.26MG-19.2B]|uniref:hypothetical protein n=1 Tax=Aestuariimicrobium sp. T2.26MG-19.2B TaxID=3040679 RepID=UPI002477ABEE|nr:hypothetical protein AESSP_00264 [Aestuariimicrobium sp. T2.26MG-19.2B]